MDLPNGPSFRTKTFAKIQDSTRNKKNISDSLQNINEIDQMKNNFEFDSDDDSRLSFFTSTDSVGEDCEEALQFKLMFKKK